MKTLKRINKTLGDILFAIFIEYFPLTLVTILALICVLVVFLLVWPDVLLR